MIFVGDDWAEDHHDVYVMDADGTRLASRRLPEGLAGSEGSTSDRRSCRGTRTGGDRHRNRSRPMGGALSAAGYQVYAINPLAVAHYRDRHQVSGAKSDASDAKLLADWYAPTATTTAVSPATAPTSKRSRSSPGPTRT